MSLKKIEQTTINAMRILALEAISNANSGHPGIVLGAAPTMYALFKDHLTVDPLNHLFFNRDRFVMSAGHGSALLYVTMLLAGYKDIHINDIQKFRQIDSKTAGHPEPSLINGIEVATGPLGQGVAMAVGLAIAEKKLSKNFNKFSNLINHYTYCLHGDGCFQEGVFYEAIALAGKLKLNKLILLYDSNNIQLDGKVSDSTITNVKGFFKSNNWNYIKVKNGNNHTLISSAISRAKRSNAPTVIEIKSIIGYGSEKEGSCTCHGVPFNAAQIKNIKKNLKYTHDSFVVPASIKKDFTDIIKKRGTKASIKFNINLTRMEEKEINLYYQVLNVIKNKFALEAKWFEEIKTKEIESTRNIVGNMVTTIAKKIPTLIIGSADLSSSTKIGNKALLFFDHDELNGQNINYGVREFAMTAINNGIMAHGGAKAIGATFLCFSDYSKPAIRLAAISQIPAINIFSHDSITVGEDGPTHQPIEQMATLRLIPNHNLFRPCNTEEAIAALIVAFESTKTPTTIITSRNEFHQISPPKFESVMSGGYIISNIDNYHTTIIATGSEVSVAVEVSKLLLQKGIMARVVSMPCVELFKRNISKYKNQVLGDKPIISIEYGSTDGWYKYADLPIGINTFGKSGKVSDVIKYFSLSPKQISMKIVDFLKIKKGQK